MASNNSSSSSNNLFLGETSSTCLTRSVTVAHKFHVPDFSLLDGMGVGKFVSSSTFSVAGCVWNLNVYPDGRCAGEKTAHASVYLCFLKGGAAVRGKFRLSLLGKDGKVIYRPQDAPLSRTFSEAAGRECGLDRFVKKSNLQEFLQRNNDCFTVRCVLTVIKESRSSEDADTFAVPASNLCQDYARMLKNREAADVTFNVDGQQFPAHRCVLSARSPVFEDEFFGPVKKKPAHDIMIDGIKPNIFEVLLHFIYTDSLPDNCNVEDNVTMQQLLVAADRYGLERLRLICEAKLCCSIGVQTVASTLVLAEQHHCVQLKDACLRFMASRSELGAVMETDGFKDLIASRPLVMKEILDKVARIKNE